MSPKKPASDTVRITFLTYLTYQTMLNELLHIYVTICDYIVVIYAIYSSYLVSLYYIYCAQSHSNKHRSIVILFDGLNIWLCSRVYLFRHCTNFNLHYCTQYVRAITIYAHNTKSHKRYRSIATHIYILIVYIEKIYVVNNSTIHDYCIVVCRCYYC